MELADLREWLYANVLCGCGQPELVVDLLRSLLPLMKPYTLDEQQALIPHEPSRYLVLYTIDRVGLTEHGTSVDGSWLTDFGKRVMAALQAHSTEAILADAD